MKTTNWDAVLASAPQDKTAAIVRDGAGEHFGVPASKVSFSRKDGPHALYDLSSGEEQCDNFFDHTGLQVGFVTVLGVVDKKVEGWSTAKRHWSFKCNCGYYESRTTGGIEKFIAEPERACCSVCDYQRKIGRDRGKDLVKITREDAEYLFTRLSERPDQGHRGAQVLKRLRKAFSLNGGTS